MKTTETNPIICGTDFSENADKAAAVAEPSRDATTS